MHRSRVRQLLLQAAPWLASGVALVALARGAWTPGSLTHAAAAALTLLAGAGVALALYRSRDARWRLPAGGDRAARVAVAPLLALVAATGALRSPALPTLALAALWSVRQRRPAVTVAAAAGMVLAVAGAGRIAGLPPAPGDLVTASALFLAVMVVPRLLVDAGAERLAQQRRRADRLGGLIGERDLTPTRPVVVTAPATAAPAWAAAGSRATGDDRRADDRRSEADALRRYLRDVRDWARAEEVVLWRWDAERDEPVAVAWSTVEADRPRFMRDDWLPLVTWAATERRPHVDRDGPMPRLAIGPVELGDGTGGALSIVHGAGMGQPREELLLWLPRYSAHVAALSELLEERAEIGRQSRRLRALVTALHEMPAVATHGELWTLALGTALKVTGGSRAVIVDWKADEGRGVVEAVSPEGVVAVGQPVTERSYVGTVCAAGVTPYVWDDASVFDPGARVYGDGEPRRVVGSLAVVPILEGDVVAWALVVEGHLPRDVSRDDRAALVRLARLMETALGSLRRVQDERTVALTDRLTGLPNRHRFDEMLKHELNRADRGSTVALVIADVDHFKQVNDNHGHAAGDAVLRAVARVLNDRVRDVDLCARYGGEEIVVLLPDTALAGAAEAAERLRAAVEARPVLVGGQYIPVTMSFGVASYPESTTTRADLFAAADRALYRAKAEGRNCVRCADTRDRRTAT